MPANKEQLRKRNLQAIKTLGLVFLAALVLFGGGTYLFTRAFVGHVRTVADYETMQLATGTYSSEVEVSGSIESGNTASVMAEVDGTVLVVAVQEGDKVKRGDVLFNIKNDKITAAVSTTLNTYTDSQKAQEKAEKNVKNAEKKLRSLNKSLAKVQDRLDQAKEKAEEEEAEEVEEGEEAHESSIDLEPYEDAVDAALAAVETAQENLDTLNGVLESAKKDTETAKKAYKKAVRKERKLTVKAASAGTIDAVTIDKGAPVSPKDEKPAMKIVDMDDIICVVQVPESQVGNVVKGQLATVVCNAIPDTQYMASVSRVSDVPTEKDEADDSGESSGSKMGDAASNGTTYDVTLALGVPDSKIKVGMSAAAKICVQDFGTVYYVPATAVASNNAGLYVEAIVDSSTTKQYSVTQIGVADDGQLVIQGASLAEGMTIRTDLSNGA